MPASSLLKLENPATNEIFATLAMPEANHLHEMIAASRRAFATWRWTPLAERVAITQRFVEEMLARREEIARVITQQMGKPLKQARAEVDTMAERARHLAAIAVEALADEILPEKPGFFRKIAHEPLGVVVDIAAW
ncbi:aldehyde dehydrogenase, partial [candidate division KSB1 bacterium]